MPFSGGSRMAAGPIGYKLKRSKRMLYLLFLYELVFYFILHWGW
jgi:hypothetical protein